MINVQVLFNAFNLDYPFYLCERPSRVLFKNGYDNLPDNPEQDHEFAYPTKRSDNQLALLFNKPKATVWQT